MPILIPQGAAVFFEEERATRETDDNVPFSS